MIRREDDFPYRPYPTETKQSRQEIYKVFMLLQRNGFVARWNSRRDAKLPSFGNRQENAIGPLATANRIDRIASFGQGVGCGRPGNWGPVTSPEKGFDGGNLRVVFFSIPL